MFRHRRFNTTISFPMLSGAKFIGKLVGNNRVIALPPRRYVGSYRRSKSLMATLRDIPLATEFDGNGPPSNFRDVNLGHK